jgi:cytochrome P450
MKIAPPLNDPDFYRGDPYPVYAWLRAQDPVHWAEPGNFWAISRHADVQFVSRSPELFTSTGGVSMPGPDGRIPTPQDLGTLLYQDPPRHRQLRRLIHPGFTARRIARLEERLRAIARDIIAKIPGADVFDFARDAATPLPSMMIAELLGAPVEDWPELIRWSDAINASQDSERSLDPREAYAAIHRYFERIIALRRSEPREDLVSLLIAAGLADAEIQSFCWLLLIAGNETTRNLLALGTLALADHPEQLARLRAEPELLPRAIEEMLRWCSPVTHMARTATRDVELRGRSIRAGQCVILLYGAANRDAEIFGAGAERFEITRHPNPHLAFGSGEHFCVGASLARLEARVFFEELLARFERIERAGPVQRMRAAMTPAVERMPLRLVARSA